MVITMEMRRSKDNNEEPKEEKRLSRTDRNQDIYKDVYLNKSYVDINNILKEDEPPKEEVVEEEEAIPTVHYEEKNYNINDYLAKAHERLTPDNDVRSLDSKDFTERESEISKLMAKIDEKAQDEDFFSSLIGDNEETLISGQLETKEITTTFEELYIETISDNNTKLSKVLSEETINNLKLEEDELNNTFQDIFKTHRLSSKKRRNLALIIFFITLFILIMVILVIIFK